MYRAHRRCIGLNTHHHPLERGLAERSQMAKAKHLDAPHDRPFAAAQGDTVRHLRVMHIGLSLLAT